MFHCSNVSKPASIGQYSFSVTLLYVSLGGDVTKEKEGKLHSGTII